MREKMGRGRTGLVANRWGLVGAANRKAITQMTSLIPAVVLISRAGPPQVPRSRSIQG